MIRVHKQEDGMAITADSDPEGTVFTTVEEWEEFLHSLRNGTSEVEDLLAHS